MPKVLLDARKLGDGGIGIYLENLILGLQPFVEQGQLGLGLIVDQSRVDSVEISQLLNTISPKVRIIKERAKCYTVDEYFLMPLRLKGVLEEFDIFHAPHYTLPFFLRCKTVATIHDIIHCSHPDSSLHKGLGRCLIQSALGRADRVITVSEHSKQQLLSGFKVSSAKLSVISNGLQRGIRSLSIAQRDMLLQLLGVGSGYGLFVGSDRPHKGLEALLVAWSILKHHLESQEKEVNKLVVVGEVGQRLREEIATLGLSGDVVILNPQSVESLSALYAGASMAVISSMEEGFGFVALEALALGCPVVSTPLPSVREIGADVPFFAQGFSAKDLFYAIKSCFECPRQQLRERSEEGLKRSKDFTIETVSQRTFDLYRQMLVGSDGLEGSSMRDEERAEVNI